MGTRPLTLLLAGCVLMGCGSGEVASKTPETAAPVALNVQSPAFANGGTIPDTYSGYGAGTQPTLIWTPIPKNTQSLVVLVEDPDAPGTKPFVHWLVINIPPSSTTVTGTALKNSANENGYYPPKPPPGKVHHYHYQVFALDVPSINATDRDSALKAIKGHVLAKGDLVGTYQAKA
ncbi:MAG TPA: YbhB/YbcL family Raf kinase inhibitor-like protein [Fimbriimonas sp.]|nr:YbhB/YbcL family Raf kinase inhibitor-like protein [Fimbriimonas sp.]